MKTLDHLLETGKKMIEAIENNRDDFEMLEDEYDYDNSDSLQYAIGSALTSLEYAKNNFSKLGSSIRMIGAEILLMAEGYEEK